MDEEWARLGEAVEREEQAERELREARSEVEQLRDQIYGADRPWKRFL